MVDGCVRAKKVEEKKISVGVQSQSLRMKAGGARIARHGGALMRHTLVRDEARTLGSETVTAFFYASPGGRGRGSGFGAVCGRGRGRGHGRGCGCVCASGLHPGHAASPPLHLLPLHLLPLEPPQKKHPQKNTHTQESTRLSSKAKCLLLGKLNEFTDSSSPAPPPQGKPQQGNHTTNVTTSRR